MRRPLIMGGMVVVILLGLTYPATKLDFSFGSLKNAPQHLESIQGTLFMRSHFAGTPSPTQVVIQHRGPGSLLQPGEMADIRALEATLRQDPEAASVIGPAEFVPASGKPSAAQQRQLIGRYLSPDRQAAIISVTARHEVGIKSAEDLVRRARTTVESFQPGHLAADTVYVGGTQASYTDFNDALYEHFPLIVGIVLLLTYVFLFYAFRSAFLPLKAVLLNLISVGASYGMLQLVFQGGIGSNLLGFSPESGVASWVPIFLFAFLFGLSMDYEVFLLSRVQESWLQTRDNTASVTLGLEKTGRLISSAALIMVIAFSGFLLGHAIQLKEFGFGLLAAIALDATLIRLVLVPSIMKLMGEWNWWVPSFLSRFAGSGATFGEGDVEMEESAA